MVIIRTPQEICDNIILSLFNGEDEFIGYIDNELTMLDTLAQLKVNNLENYYIVHNGEKFYIKNNKIKHWRGYSECGLDSIMEKLVGF